MDHHGLTIIEDIGWSIVFAGVTAYLARLLKQPLLLGYIVAGAVHVVVPGWIAGHDLYVHVKPLV